MAPPLSGSNTRLKPHPLALNLVEKGPRRYGLTRAFRKLHLTNSHRDGNDPSLRSRSAANESAARMSGDSKSGKSARISDSVMPDAK